MGFVGNVGETPILANTIKDSPHLQRIIYVDTEGERLFNVVRNMEMEGIVAKLKTSKYIGQRTSDWLKIINWTFVDATIIGYRKKEFGLLCKYNDSSSIVELGFNQSHKKLIYGHWKDLFLYEDKKFTYFKPLIKCRLRGRGFNRRGYLRTPIFEEYFI